MDDQAAILYELRTMNALLRDLPTSLAIVLAADRNRVVAEEDRATLALILENLYDAIGEAYFTLQDLEEQAPLDPGLADALGQLVGRGVSRKSLGKLLARCAGVDIDGIVIWKRDKVRAGQRWQLKRA